MSKSKQNQAEGYLKPGYNIELKSDQPPLKSDESFELYTEKEVEYLDRYQLFTNSAFEDEELYEVLIKYDFDDIKITRELEKMMRDLKKGDEYKWQTVEKGKGKKKKEEDQVFPVEYKKYFGKNRENNKGPFNKYKKNMRNDWGEEDFREDAGRNLWNQGKGRENKNYEMGSYRGNYRRGGRGGRSRGRGKKDFHYYVQDEREFQEEPQKFNEVEASAPQIINQIKEEPLEEERFSESIANEKQNFLNENNLNLERKASEQKKSSLDISKGELSLQPRTLEITSPESNQYRIQDQLEKIDIQIPLQKQKIEVVATKGDVLRCEDLTSFFIAKVIKQEKETQTEEKYFINQFHDLDLSCDYFTIKGVQRPKDIRGSREDLPSQSSAQSTKLGLSQISKSIPSAKPIKKTEPSSSVATGEYPQLCYGIPQFISPYQQPASPRELPNYPYGVFIVPQAYPQAETLEESSVKNRKIGSTQVLNQNYPGMKSMQGGQHSAFVPYPPFMYYNPNPYAHMPMTGQVNPMEAQGYVGNYDMSKIKSSGNEEINSGTSGYYYTQQP